MLFLRVGQKVNRPLNSFLKLSIERYICHSAPVLIEIKDINKIHIVLLITVLFLLPFNCLVFGPHYAEGF